MINIIATANKVESLPVLYQKALYFIQSHAERKGYKKNGIIPFPEIYQTLTTMLHLGKEDAIKVFDELKEAGLLEIVPFHGIRIKGD